MGKKAKTRKQRFQQGPVPHGAVHHCIFRDGDLYDYELLFASTAAGDCDYPVHFYGLPNIKKLHKWLGDQIAKAESENQ